eukprot:TRINITY_DN4869_c0_g1_i1.p1 TRINITY_DN4869_c0_g1~~TRINITY_DN4869_c0_g1_i1.p1  ORF type:complete len:353 (-),score=90.01 TRINITY_DN4869_c0_g1_i1:184-1134(-)
MENHERGSIEEFTEQAKSFQPIDEASLETPKKHYGFSQWKFKQSDVLREEERRQRKLESNALKKVKERQRRSKMSQSIQHLRKLVPHCQQEKKLNQSAVMSRTVDYIRYLQERVSELERQLKSDNRSVRIPEPTPTPEHVPNKDPNPEDGDLLLRMLEEQQSVIDRQRMSQRQQQEQMQQQQQQLKHQSDKLEEQKRRLEQQQSEIEERQRQIEEQKRWLEMRKNGKFVANGSSATAFSRSDSPSGSDALTVGAADIVHDVVANEDLQDWPLYYSAVDGPMIDEVGMKDRDGSRKKDSEFSLLDSPQVFYFEDILS